MIMSEYVVMPDSTAEARVHVSLTLPPALAEWVDEARGETPRTRFVQVCLEAVQEAIGTQARALDADAARALAALRSFQLGTVPPEVDLRALARTFREEEPGEATP